MVEGLNRRGLEETNALRRNSMVRFESALMTGRTDYLERADQALADPHDRASIVKLSAVIRRGEDSK